MAAKLQCEICGGKLIGRPGGIYECDSCGMEYDTAWAKAKIQEITGTVKVEGTVEVTGKVQIDGPVKVEGGANKEALLQRGQMALEEKEWDKAKEFFNQALNFDAQCAEAYLGNLMAEQRVSRQSALTDCERPFDLSRNYRNAVRFGDAELSSTLQGYIRQINERNENDRQLGIYNEAWQKMNSACTETEFRIAAAEFQTIHGFKDADILAVQCMERAEECRKDAIYASAKSWMIGDMAWSYEAAIKAFNSISGWKDADALAEQCIEKANEKKNIAEGRATLREVHAALVLAALRRKFAPAESSLEKQLEKTSNVVRSLEKLLCEFDDIWLELEKARADMAELQRQHDELTVRRTKLGLFSGKEKKQIDTELAELKSKQSALEAHQFQTVDRFCGYNAKADLEKKLAAAKAKKAALESQFEKESEGSICFDEAVDLYTKNTEIANEVNRIDPLTSIRLASLLKTDLCTFGRYIKRKNGSPEPIEWQIIARKKSRWLLISKYALGWQPYDMSETGITWETCSLRTWLNKTFLNTAFSEKERGIIPSVKVSADKNPEWSTNPGNSTTDRIFLLSITEVKQYFSSDAKRQCRPTEDLRGHACDEISDAENCEWWLRTPGYNSDCAVVIENNGSICTDGNEVNFNAAVRPALWIEIGE